MGRIKGNSHRTVINWPRGQGKNTYCDSVIPKLWGNPFHGPAADYFGDQILRRFDNEMMSDFISENMMRDLFIGKMAGFVVWLDKEDRIQVQAFGGKGYGDND